MLILRNWETFESSLPDMTAASIVPMISTNMAGQPPLHKGTQRIGSQGLQHEMKMIRHQVESKDFHRIFCFRNNEQIKKGPVVLVFMKDGGPPIATVDDVVDMTGDLSAGDTRHGGNTTTRVLLETRKSSLSPFSFHGANTDNCDKEIGTDTTVICETVAACLNSQVNGFLLRHNLDGFVQNRDHFFKLRDRDG